jgi:hypothetical protein
MQFRIIGPLVATGNVAEAGEVHGISALRVGLTESGPSVWHTKADGVGGVVVGVDDGGIGRLSGKVLECTLIGTGRLAVNLNLITANEGGNPVLRPVGERSATRDANVGTGVIDGQLASGDLLAVIAANLGPLEDVDTVGYPRGDFHILADAFVGVTGIEAIAVAVASVALALDNILIVEEVLLILGRDIVNHGFDESHFDEATIMVVPPPFDRDLLAALEVVLRRDIGAIETTGILVRRGVGRILVPTRNREEHVRVGDNRRSGEEGSDKDVLEHLEKKSIRKMDLD